MKKMKKETIGLILIFILLTIYFWYKNVLSKID